MITLSASLKARQAAAKAPVVPPIISAVSRNLLIDASRNDAVSQQKRYQSTYDNAGAEYLLDQADHKQALSKLLQNTNTANQAVAARLSQQSLLLRNNAAQYLVAGVQAQNAARTASLSASLATEQARQTQFRAQQERQHSLTGIGH